MKTSSTLSKIIVGAGATVLVLLVSLYLSFQRFKELQNANSWNVHTYQVLLETSNLIRSLVEIQTGARGFLQTGDEIFLEPYQTGQSEFKEHFDQALLLTRDRTIQQKRLQLLRRQYSIWMKGHMEPLITMRRDAPNTEAALRLAAPSARKRKIIMDAMRKTVASMEETELTLLRQRSEREDQLQSVTQLTLLINGTFALVMAAVLSLMVATGARKLQAANRLLTEQMTQRERAESEAEIFNEHNEMILQAASEGITGINQTGKTTFFNPAAEEITGYSAAEVIGKAQHDLLHFKRLDGSPYPVGECPISSTLKDGKVHKAADEVFWRKDGTPISVEFTSAPLRMPSDEEDSDNGNKQVGAVIIFRDVTNRRKSEMALRDLASIVQYADDAIMGFSLDGRITRWNRAATHIYGFSEFEIVGQYVEKLIPSGMPNELPELLAKIKAHEAVERYETTRLRKDGSQIQVVLSLSPILDEAGEVVGASSISREVFRNRIRRASETGDAAAPQLNDAANNGPENINT